MLDLALLLRIRVVGR